MKFSIPYKPPYPINPKYEKSIAYFCMEYAIDQSLKIYSGGLGFLSGSHMRSAYDLKQNLVGIGILWKYGYYDQVRKGDKTMAILFQEKSYSFLEDTGITFNIKVNNHPVYVKAYYLKPETFGTAPIFLLSTDLPENDYLAQTISHKLYDSNTSTRIAQYILLGLGGAKLIEILGFNPEIFHMNEAHAISSAFHLYEKYKDMEEVKKRFVLTTHTPEKAGNEEHELNLLENLGFFNGIPTDQVNLMNRGSFFNHTLSALKMAKIANGVSRKHGEVSREMWSAHSDIGPIISITNAQNRKYWADMNLYGGIDRDDNEYIKKRKLVLKKKFFEVIADQTGKIFDPEVLTIVWARRFAGYKRPDLITSDFDRFKALMDNKDMPVQIIWAGKPFPVDFGSISIFDNLVHMNKQFMNGAILVGYELWLSKMCKRGADIWLNTPRIPHEASGTSGMTAAMNGAINLSTYDGWIREFGQHKENCFLIPEVSRSLPVHEQDKIDAENLLHMLENEVLPAYYSYPEQWQEIQKNSMRDVLPYFDANRMADEYYRKLYHYNPGSKTEGDINLMQMDGGD